MMKSSKQYVGTSFLDVWWSVACSRTPHSSHARGYTVLLEISKHQEETFLPLLCKKKKKTDNCISSLTQPTNIERLIPYYSTTRPKSHRLVPKLTDPKCCAQFLQQKQKKNSRRQRPREEWHFFQSGLATTKPREILSV